MTQPGIMRLMDVRVRDAAPEDAADGLLYESARAYYDAYFRGEARARRALKAVYGQPGHTASYAICRVAEDTGGRIVGVLAQFPSGDGQELARRFMSLTLPRLQPWQWPRLWRHLRLSGRVSPSPPRGSWYVDALAVAEPARRRGVARTLLDDAERAAREHGAVGVALDTGLQNTAARALYEHCGFDRRDVRPVRGARAVRALGGPGFVGYFKPVSEA